MEYFWKVAKDRTLIGTASTAKLEQAEGELVDAETERKAWQSSKRLQALGDAFIEGLEERVTIEDAARERVAQVRADLAHPELGDVTTLEELWEKLSGAEKRDLVGSVVGAVYVRKAKVKGNKESASDRSMIFAKGDEPDAPRRGSKPFPILPLEVPVPA
jgi:hypothetical protein